MKPTITNSRTIVLTAIVLLTAILRVIIANDHSPLTNFTPIGAIALFGGSYFTDKRKAFIVPLLALWISDLFLNYFVYYHQWKWFYDGFIVTYASYLLMVMIGLFIKKVSIINVTLASIIAALAHWIITDFGVWLDGRLYPQTYEGLIACYVAAIPYLNNMVIGNLLFGAMMFGAFELAQKKYPSVRLNAA